MRIAAALLLLALSGPVSAAGETAAPDERPFPVPDRSMILREEKVVYIVEGRVRIPRGVELSIQKDVHIRSRNGPAVIEVEGDLEVHGVTKKEVIFEGVTVEPCASFEKIQLDSCIFREGGGLSTAKGAPAAGDITVQLCRFQGKACIDVAMTGGSIQVLDTSHDPVARFAGVDAPGATNRLKAVFRAFSPNGLVAENIADLTIRFSRICSDPLTLRDNAVLLVDGCKVQAKEISFIQTKAGGFGRTKVIKTDLYAKRILFSAPADPKVIDTVVLDKCWFEGECSKEAIAARVVDADDDPGNNVRVLWVNPQERPLELAGKLDR